MLEQLDDRQPLAPSVPDQRAATMRRGRQIRRTRRAIWAASVATTATVLVAAFSGLPARLSAPDPIAPTPRPTGPATLLYPLCDPPSDEATSFLASPGPPRCTSSEQSGLYASALRLPAPPLRFTVVLPAGWTAVGGFPAYPTGYGYFPKGSTSFASAGDVGTVQGLSLINRDGTAGLLLEGEPTIASCASGACQYLPPPADLVGFLRDRSGTGTVRRARVGGLMSSIVELAPASQGAPSSGGLGCSVPYPCAPLLAYNIPPDAGGGSGPPTMGRLGTWPTRMVVIPVPRDEGTVRVVVWLWSVVDRPTGLDERDLDGLEEIVRSIRFDGVAGGAGS